MTFARRVLVIEDDPETAEQLVDCLRTNAYEVDVALDGDERMSRGWAADYTVMTVDRMLPHIDGIELIRHLRGSGIATPALIIGALGEVDERVRGLTPVAAVSTQTSTPYPASKTKKPALKPGPIAVNIMRRSACFFSMARSTNSTVGADMLP
jgi:CheY-like chemotaxis protein